jgi:hypothetical protein
MPARQAWSSMRTRPPQRRGGLGQQRLDGRPELPGDEVVVVIALAVDHADEQSEQQEATEGENHAPKGSPLGDFARREGLK